jgi:hypothetical protein
MTAAAFSTEDRQKGFQTMTAQLSPAARVRRRFLQGRSKKVDVLHTPLSAINEAVQGLSGVLVYIETQEPTLPPDSVRCALVYVSGTDVNLRWVTPERGLTLLQELTALSSKFTALGLVFIIQELAGDSVNLGGWVKPFIWSHDNLDILGGMLNRQLALWEQK